MRTNINRIFLSAQSKRFVSSFNSFGKYHDVYKKSLDVPKQFWEEQSHHIDWFEKTGPIFEEEQARWFGRYMLNTCYNCVDRHVLDGHGARTAILFESAYTGETKQITYMELLREVSLFAGALQNAGIKKGDRVLIYMPPLSHALIGMLACARIGAVHSVVFSGFAANELAKRIVDCQPKAILTASCGMELQRQIPYMPIVNEALEQARQHDSSISTPVCIVLQRPELLNAELEVGRDFEWYSFVENVGQKREAACVPVYGADPLYILYTSGTSGNPKGVVRDNGGHAVMTQWSINSSGGLKAGETLFSYSDFGWLMGHTYTAYGPLLNGSSTLLFEGKPVPDASTFFRLIEKYRPVAMCTAPTAFRLIRKYDPLGIQASKYDIDTLRALVLGGEHLDTSTLHWLHSILNTNQRKERGYFTRIFDGYGSTESGTLIAGSPNGIEQLEVSPGSVGYPLPGNRVRILNEYGQEVPSGQEGNICIQLPLAPGFSSSLWRNTVRAKQTYLNKFQSYFDTSDVGYIDKSGCLHVTSRVEDLLKVAGRRISTMAMEEVICSHPSVSEAVVLGITDSIKGQIPVCVCVAKENISKENISKENLQEDIIQIVREKFSATTNLRQVFIVSSLPRGKTGKVLRRLLRLIIEQKPCDVSILLDDQTIVREITAHVSPSTNSI